MRHRDTVTVLVVLAGWLSALAVVGALVVQARSATLERGMRTTAGLAERRRALPALRAGWVRKTPQGQA